MRIASAKFQENWFIIEAGADPAAKFFKKSSKLA